LPDVQEFRPQVLTRTLDMARILGLRYYSSSSLLWQTKYLSQHGAPHTKLHKKQKAAKMMSTGTCHPCHSCPSVSCQRSQNDRSDENPHQTVVEMHPLRLSPARKRAAGDLSQLPEEMRLYRCHLLHAGLRRPGEPRPQTAIEGRQATT